MLGLIERLEHVRAIGIEPGRGHRSIRRGSLSLLREAGRTTVQHVAGYERQRRHATLVAISLDLAASLTDQAIDLFDRLIGAMFRKAEGTACPCLPGRCPGHQREGPPLRARRRRADRRARGQAGRIRRDRRGDPVGAVSHDRRGGRGAGAAGGVRRSTRSLASTMPASGAGRPLSSMPSPSRACRRRRRSCAPSRCCAK